MRTSQLYAPTLREVPAEAEVISHKLMLRAGMIRKAAGGLYTYLPLAWRTIKKIEQIIREEMDAAGGQEIAMPIVQPSELWKETGRWEVYGDEMFRLNDRHGREFCLGPTHEEMVTSIVRDEVRSYKQLPLLLYQIQNKYRDEIRPRFGLMRGREFIMKDLYSFDKDEEGMRVSYKKMYDAYTNIFTRCGLKFRPVEADNGAIGGGGLGSMALNLGYQRRMNIILWVSVVVLVILVQIFQSIGTCLAVRFDRRIGPGGKRRRRKEGGQDIQKERKSPGTM